METAVLKVDAQTPDADTIRRAADVIRAGGLVAFPTETVYGLGANVLSADAVAGIFAAKGRPGTNPLIVHVADVSEVLNVAAEWPETAAQLAAKFWPGPLTLVVPKRDAVPDIVTASGPTVAVRCPNHAVARALIRAAGVPLAAPSANRSTELSPTRAEHVLKGLAGRIDLVLDGGPCPGGIESTVVDVTGAVPRVLRPGLITVSQLEAECGRVQVGAKGEGVARAPGQMAKHYSPRAEVVLCGAGLFDLDNELYWERLSLSAPCQVGVLEFGSDFWAGNRPSVICRVMPTNAEAYAAKLYETLHELDQLGVARIVVELPPDAAEWAAVRDRLTRAAARE